MIVEGFEYTRSRPKYFLRLLVVALVAQILFYFAASYFGFSYTHNAIFTLAFAFVSLICAERGGFYIIAIPLLALVAGALECEYGVCGNPLVAGFYYAKKLLRGNRYLYIVAQSVVLLAAMSLQTLVSGWVVQIYSLLAIVPIALYSGKKGRRLPRGIGYVYYPAHLFVLLLIKLLFF